MTQIDTRGNLSREHSRADGKNLNQSPEFQEAVDDWEFLLKTPTRGASDDIKVVPFFEDDHALSAISTAAKRKTYTDSVMVGQIIGMALIDKVDQLEQSLPHRITSKFIYGLYRIQKWLPFEIKQTSKGDIMTQTLQVVAELNDPLVLSGIFSTCNEKWPPDSVHRAELYSAALKHMRSSSEQTGMAIAYAVDGLNHHLTRKEPLKHCIGILGKAIVAFQKEWVKNQLTRDTDSTLERDSDHFHIGALAIYGCFKSKELSGIELYLLIKHGIELHDHIRKNEETQIKMPEPNFNVPDTLKSSLQASQNELLTEPLLEYATEGFDEKSKNFRIDLLRAIGYLLIHGKFRFANHGAMICALTARYLYNPQSTRSLSFLPVLDLIAEDKGKLLNQSEVAEFIKNSSKGPFMDLILWIERTPIEPARGNSLRDTQHALIKEVFIRWSLQDWAGIGELFLSSRAKLALYARKVNCTGLGMKSPLSLHAQIGDKISNDLFQELMEVHEELLSTPEKVKTAKLLECIEVWAAHAALMRESLKLNESYTEVLTWIQIFNLSEAYFEILEGRSDIPKKYDIQKLKRDTLENLMWGAPPNDNFEMLKAIGANENYANWRRNIICDAWLTNHSLHRGDELNSFQVAKIIALALGLADHHPENGDRYQQEKNENRLGSDWVERKLINAINLRSKDFRIKIKEVFKGISLESSYHHKTESRRLEAVRINYAPVDPLKTIVEELTKMIKID